MTLARFLLLWLVCAAVVAVPVGHWLGGRTAEPDPDDDTEWGRRDV